MRLGFFLADDEQRRDFRQRMLADLVVDLLVAQVDFDAQAGTARGGGDHLGVFVAFRGDGGDDGLHRRQPERKIAGEMFDQNADEAFHRAADRAMHHHRHLLRAVGIDVERTEPFRQIEVDLRGAALPIAADGVAQYIFEFRAVECAFARIDRGLDAVVVALRLDLRQHGCHHALSVVPHLVGADALARPGREFDREIAGEAKIRVGRQDQIVDLETLVGELLLGAEHMGVVLGKSAHAHQAVHRAGRLVAMHHAEFGEPQRQIAVAFQAVLEDLHVAGAVHRL